MSPKARPLSRQFTDAVSTAFPVSAPPSKEQIAEGLYESELWIVDALTGRSWNQLDPGTIDRLEIDVLVLPKKVFQYYLPALLLRACQTQNGEFVTNLASTIRSKYPDKASSAQKKILDDFLGWAEQWCE